MQFQFVPSDELTKKHYIETGSRRLNCVIEVDDAILTPEQRAGMVKTEEALAQFGHTRILRHGIGEMYVSEFGTISFKPLDEVPTLDQAVQMYIDMADQLTAIKVEYDAYQAEQKRIRQERFEATQERNRLAREIREREADRREAARAEKIANAQNIAWDEHGKAILDLQETLFLLSGDEQDSRFRSWVKIVTGVEQHHDNGYDFVGEFVQPGTVEIERGNKAVYLVASTTGSRKYQTVVYRVIVMTEAGQFERTEITTTNDKPGWALRIRDQVKALIS